MGYVLFPSFGNYDFFLLDYLLCLLSAIATMAVTENKILRLCLSAYCKYVHL